MRSLCPLLFSGVFVAGWASVAHEQLPRVESFDHESLEWDPELVGRYHTDAFDRLRKRYEHDDATTNDVVSWEHVVASLVEILSDYCPTRDHDHDSCARRAHDLARRRLGATTSPDDDDDDDEPKKSVRSARDDELMRRVEEILRANVEKGRDETQEALAALKDEIAANENLDVIDKRSAATKLSIASESHALWHEVAIDPAHPLSRLRRAVVLRDAGLSDDDDENELRRRRLQFDVSMLTDVVFADLNIYVDENSDFFGIIFESIVASIEAFFGLLIGQVSATSSPSDEPSVSSAPSTPVPSVEPTVSSEPTHPTAAPTDSPATPPPVTTPEPTPAPTRSPTPAPTRSPSPSQRPSTSHYPSLGLSTLNEVITCLSIIDEAYEHDYDVFRRSWTEFRNAFPDRPFCLLQPAVFHDAGDEADIIDFYPQGLSESMLRIPPDFYSDPLTTFAQVSRDMGDASVKDDWYELCDLEGLREQGITRIAFFIDQSGSLETHTVESSYRTFLDRLEDARVEIVAGIYNDEERWIKPFLTNFGYGDNYDNPFEDDDDDWCRNGNGGARTTLLDMFKNRLGWGGSTLPGGDE